jgi:hypothetical protein
MDNLENKDGKLWKIAKRRAAFKRYLITYIIVNLFLWAIWAFSSYRSGYYEFIWPLYISLGWGIGLFFSFTKAYLGVKENMVESEYNKLKNNQGN